MIFDVYPNRLIVSKPTSRVGISFIRDGLVTNGEDDEGQAYNVLIGRSRPEMELYQNEPQALQLTNPIPQPFSVLNTPSAVLEPDGSYAYTPDVYGGVSPYSFEFSGTLPEGWSFHSGTGSLSGPPA